MSNRAQKLQCLLKGTTVGLEVKMESMIEIDELAMMYRVPVRGEGVRAAVRSLYHRTYREIPAVDGISLELEAGEIVGFLGPNGAGKTTTMKMLSGVLRPTGGTVSVAGFDPWERKPAYLKQIALIRGSQPLGGQPELTVMDVLRLQQLVYEIGEGVFRRSLALLSEMLGLGPLLDRQIRALSLGERMRCGLANALVYQPQVLFLDEPTIGMDVAVVEATRTFIEHYRDTTGATVLLTSHAMADVERLCPRVIVIDHGRVQFDGPLRELVERWAPASQQANPARPSAGRCLIRSGRTGARPPHGRHQRRPEPAKGGKALRSALLSRRQDRRCSEDRQPGGRQCRASWRRGLPG